MPDMPEMPEMPDMLDILDIPDIPDIPDLAARTIGAASSVDAQASRAMWTAGRGLPLTRGISCGLMFIKTCFGQKGILTSGRVRHAPARVLCTPCAEPADRGMVVLVLPPLFVDDKKRDIRRQVDAPRPCLAGTGMPGPLPGAAATRLVCNPPPPCRHGLLRRPNHEPPFLPSRAHSPGGPGTPPCRSASRFPVFFIIQTSPQGSDACKILPIPINLPRQIPLQPLPRP